MLNESQKNKIDDAVCQDYNWLVGEAQDTEAWRGTDPSNVSIFGLGDQSATAITIDRMGLSDEKHDAALEYAEAAWDEAVSNGPAERYEVISKQGSASMGAYEGDTPAEALATYVRDAGYSAEVVNEETVKTDDPAPCGGYELQGDDESYHHLKVRQ